jgi:hypothetical protein
MPLVVLTHGHPDTPPPPFVEPEEPSWRQLQPELVLDAITTSSKPRGLATWCPTDKTAR